jgi:hypothetical protein
MMFEELDKLEASPLGKRIERVRVNMSVFEELRYIGESGKVTPQNAGVQYSKET